MNEDPSNLSCHLFQERLPEMIGSGEDLANQPHLLGCPLCRALLADLETIAEAARQLFPVAEPPDDLWLQIESALQKEEASPQADPGTGR
jgi:hypothetical protein